MTARCKLELEVLKPQLLTRIQRSRACGDLEENHGSRSSSVHVDSNLKEHQSKSQLRLLVLSLVVAGAASSLSLRGTSKLATRYPAGI